MTTKKFFWDYRILDAYPGRDVIELHSLAIGDVYNEGRDIIFSGGKNGLFWFRPDTLEKGKISEGFFHVGLAVEDIDGDGISELIAAKELEGGGYSIIWFKPDSSPEKKWKAYTIDDNCMGNPHDLVFADIDGDGKNELISVAAYTKTPGVFIHKPGNDMKRVWKRHAVMLGYHTEGISVAHIKGEQKPVIVSGPDCLRCPAKGPYSGLWNREVFAPGFRDMCRTAAVDITGNGNDDIVIVESEYKEGRLSWFEFRPEHEKGKQWIEHRISDDMDFAHSLCAWKAEESKTKIFTGEMFEGGWNQPYNFNARILELTSSDGGATWDKSLIQKGVGTHQAVVYDIDGDGELEVVGKTWQRPVIQIFKKNSSASPVLRFNHRFVDRDKPGTGIDIFTDDINGDGLEDVICGKWWYTSPAWERHEIPGIEQVVKTFDVDGDGRVELICTKGNKGRKDNGPVLTSDFCWLKPINPEKGKWEEYPIGRGTGSWPHGTGMVKFANGEKAFLAAYHSAKQHNDYPEIFTVSQDPRQRWDSKVFAQMNYGEEIKAADITGSGNMDIIMGNFWFENSGDNTFVQHRYTEKFENARLCVSDINNDGKPDIVSGEEVYQKYRGEPAMVFARLAWFENRGTDMWKMHVIDRLRSPHSVSVDDIDGDGEIEIICGEHDPFRPMHSRCRLFVYKKADPDGLSWYRYLLDDRFEHHNGAKTISLANGKKGIVSHGWANSQFVHLWEPEA